MHPESKLHLRKTTLRVLRPEYLKTVRGGVETDGCAAQMPSVGNGTESLSC